MGGHFISLGATVPVVGAVNGLHVQIHQVLRDMLGRLPKHIDVGTILSKLVECHGGQRSSVLPLNDLLGSRQSVIQSSVGGVDYMRVLPRLVLSIQDLLPRRKHESRDVADA